MAVASAKVRLTIRVSKTTDRYVRAFLGASKMRRGELSRFVEEAVQRQLFWVMLDNIHQRNAISMQADLDRAVKEVRAERKRQLRRRKNSTGSDAVVA